MILDENVVRLSVLGEDDDAHALARELIRQPCVRAADDMKSSSRPHRDVVILASDWRVNPDELDRFSGIVLSMHATAPIAEVASTYAFASVVRIVLGPALESGNAPIAMSYSGPDGGAGLGLARQLLASVGQVHDVPEHTLPFIRNLMSTLPALALAGLQGTSGRERADAVTRILAELDGAAVLAKHRLTPPPPPESRGGEGR